MVNNPRQDDAMWVWYDPLRDAMERLIALTRDGENGVTGDLMGALARRLIAAETAPGGPYRDSDGSLGREANAAVARFFDGYDMPLPNVNAWLAENGGIPAIHHAVKTVHTQRPPASKVIGTRARSDIQTLPVDARGPALALWLKITRIDKAGEITGLTGRFVRSLAARPALESSVVDNLALANFYVWMAYTVYDDFIDKDGHAPDLPAANMAHRRASDLFTREEGSSSVSAACFDAMDAANAWELARCRFATDGRVIRIGRLPDYGDRMVLARRAGAHILGPRIVMIRTGKSPADNDAATAALSHYLVARQLNDDLHDWADDLARGHISPVVAHLLKACAVAPSEYGLADLTATLKRAFWDGGLADIGTVALDHVRAAYALETAGILISDSPFMQQIVAPIERSLRASQHVHADDRSFLAAYGHGVS